METIPISFQINYHTQFGNSVFVVGDIEELGEWNPKKAFPLSWAPGDIWVGQIDLSPQRYRSIEYKYITGSTDLGQEFLWEPYGNRTLVLQDQLSIDVSDCWNYQNMTIIPKLTEDLIEKEFSREGVKVEENLESINEQELTHSIKSSE